MKPYIIGFIFARGGSKGVKKKNIRQMAGKPLIAYAIETAKQSKLIDRVIVSTEDEEIARIALEFGAEVPFMRPKELAQDDSPEIHAWRHAIQMLKKQDKSIELDVFVSLPPTAPLRVVEDVDNCIRCFLENEVDVVITVKKANRHPSFNMVFLDKDKRPKLALPSDKYMTHRQSIDPVYDVTTVAYVARPEFVLNATSSVYEGNLKAVLIPEERAVDIDSELDFKFAEFLMTNRMKTNEKN